MSAGETTGDATPTEMTDLLLFAYHQDSFFTGSLAELRIFQAAHPAPEVVRQNTSLLQKWARLFPPADRELVVFVGNSLTTGMFCGNGQTWSRLAAMQVPGLRGWYNVSRGGITTQGLAALAAASVDPLLRRATGRKTLVLWEGTNDLVVNRATAAGAHEAIGDFCRARRAAGWQRIVVLTILPREAGPDFEARRTELNDLLRQHYREYADALADVAAATEIGPAGAETNRTYYADGVHLTAAGNALVAATVRAVLTP